jgi:hypothetical protein
LIYVLSDENDPNYDPMRPMTQATNRIHDPRSTIHDPKSKIHSLFINNCLKAATGNPDFDQLGK